MSDETIKSPAVEVPDTITVTRDEVVPPLPIETHGSIPPTLKEGDFAFASALRNAPRQEDHCRNCGSKNHLFRACPKPLRNEELEVAAMRAKGLIHDEDKMIQKGKAKDEKENLSLKTETVVSVKEIEVKKHDPLLG